MGKRAIALDEHLVVLQHDGRERLGWIGVVNDRSGARPVNRAMFFEEWDPATQDGPMPVPVCEALDANVLQDLGTFATFWDDPANLDWLIPLGALDASSALRLVRAVAIVRRMFRPHPVQAADSMVLIERAIEVHGPHPGSWPMPALSALLGVAAGEAERANQETDAREAWAARIAEHLEPGGASAPSPRGSSHP